MSQKHLVIEKLGPVLSLTLNRPESLNAFSPEMILGLTEAIKNAKNDDDVRVIVLSGAGRSFSAGGDVKTMGQANVVQVYEHIGRLNRLNFGDEGNRKTDYCCCSRLRSWCRVQSSVSLRPNCRCGG